VGDEDVGETERRELRSSGCVGEERDDVRSGDMDG
jgi:hypothetical protein